MYNNSATFLSEVWEKHKRLHGTAEALRQFTREHYVRVANEHARSRAWDNLQEKVLVERLIARKVIKTSDESNLWFQRELRHVELRRLDPVALFVRGPLLQFPLLRPSADDTREVPPKRAPLEGWNGHRLELEAPRAIPRTSETRREEPAGPPMAHSGVGPGVPRGSAPPVPTTRRGAGGLGRARESGLWNLGWRN